MVARTPQKQRKVTMVAPLLNSDLLKETINKVDKCMERLQELQYTIAGGTKVVSGVNLSPRSTRTYLKTSLRCKQETLRIKNATNKKSPIGKFPASSPGDWRKMSLPAMLLGETVNEILQASQVTRDIVDAFAPKKSRNSRRSLMAEEEEDDPKTPSKPDTQTVTSNIKARRKKEKQNKRSESDSPPPPSLQKARSRIAFKIISPQQKAEKSFRHVANRVSPKHKPWVKKAVLFPNPLFLSATSTNQAKFSRTMSPIITKNSRETPPHKFLIKSPPKAAASKFQVKIKSPPKFSVSPNLARKSPRSSSSPTRNVKKLKSPPKFSVSPTRNTSNLARKSPKFSVSPTRNGTNLARKSPKGSISPTRRKKTVSPMRNGSNLAQKSSISPARNDSLCKKSHKALISPTKKSHKLSTAAKLRRSFSPSRLAMRLMSPLKSRKSVRKCDDDEMMMMSGLKQLPVLVPKRFSMGRI